MKPENAMTREQVERDYGYLLSCLDTDIQIAALQRLQDIALRSLPAEGGKKAVPQTSMPARIGGESEQSRQSASTAPPVEGAAGEPDRLEPQYYSCAVSGQRVKDWMDYADTLAAERDDYKQMHAKLSWCLKQSDDERLAWKQKAEAMPTLEQAERQPAGRVVPEAPTEEMVDAPRQIILYAETPGRSLEGLREHLDSAGVDYSCFPDWAKNDKGHLTKSAIAILIWTLMQSAAPKQGGES